MSVAASAVSDFTFDQDDVLGQHSKISLFGREQELTKLTDEFKKVKNTNSFASIAIHGLSGTGKTSLARKLQEFVCEKEGFFCTGKCFQNSGLGQDPFSALMAAFSDLCDLTIQSTDFSEERRSEIQKALGSHGKLLENNITNISPFLEGQSMHRMHEAKNETAFAAFKVSCKAFLRAMTANKGHTVVIFLDDVQWMDKGSKDLLEDLVQDTDFKNFLLIFAYRDEQVNMIGEVLLNSKKYNIVDVPLENLSLEALTEMVSVKLESPQGDKIYDLSKLILHKTQGNPFYILQFIDSVKKNGMLTKDINSWIYDVQRISRETVLSEPLVELLSLKVQRLAWETQEILKVASLLGYQFKEDLVLKIATKLLKLKNESLQVTMPALKRLLENAANDAFLSQINDGYYQFSHDKLQDAFRSLIDEADLPKLHLMIGRELTDNTDEISMYHAAVHLNRSSLNTNGSMQERVDLARTNLQAAKYCKKIYAFMDAVALLKSGIDLLGSEDNWSKQFDLTFEMTELLAQMQFATGDFMSCKATNQELLKRAKSTEMKINAFRNEVEVRMASMEDVGKVGKRALKELGIHLPERDYSLHIYSKLKKVRFLVNNCEDEDILNKQTRSDPVLSTAMHILVVLSADCFMRKKFMLGLYTSLLATELTMSMGIFPDSGIAIVGYGIVEALLGKEDVGYRMGDLAIRMLDKYPAKSARAIVIGQATGQLIWLKRRLKDLAPLHKELLMDLLDYGDVLSVKGCGWYYLNVRLWSGDNLQSLEDTMRHIYHVISELGQVTTLIHFQPILQIVSNLRYRFEDWNEQIILTGKFMEEEKYVKETIDSIMFFIELYKMFLSYTFGYYQSAQAIGKKLSKDKLAAVTFLFLPINFYYGMTCYQQYSLTGSKRLLRTARKCKAVLEQKQASGNLDVIPHLRIMEIEELALKEKYTYKILAACNVCIEFQEAEGFLHLEALANERAYCILRKLRCPYAEKYLDQTMQVCKNWGALAKYEWLIEEHNYVDSFNLEKRSAGSVVTSKACASASSR
eukprot:CAMPEP_0178898092 /NCGR_PEP_ID=MMETSP0786-20121207/2130_1 /TAXON_ID=186022 /ORGANISM="Thalassionema frauenfeldii, Strain CCMP 1798" /LENGTH=1030 /DNA_ID=CAMNT_0020568755 /DNA_START=121 /DNA_END=3212 /DNA_ORIENTATION=+